MAAAKKREIKKKQIRFDSIAENRRIKLRYIEM